MVLNKTIQIYLLATTPVLLFIYDLFIRNYRISGFIAVCVVGSGIVGIRFENKHYIM